jgi:hypothetical protein
VCESTKSVHYDIGCFHGVLVEKARASKSDVSAVVPGAISNSEDFDLFSPQVVGRTFKPLSFCAMRLSAVPVAFRSSSIELRVPD